MNPLEYPYSCVGYLSIKFKSGVYGGTGCLIGKNYIITAAKNLYHRKFREMATDIWFFPGLMGNIGKAIKVKDNFYIPKKYINA